MRDFFELCRCEGKRREGLTNHNIIRNAPDESFSMLFS